MTEQIILGGTAKSMFLVDAKGNQLTSPTAQAGYATTPINAAALTANTDYTFSWSAQVNHVMIQNNSALTVSWDLDAVTSAGSPTLGPNQSLFLDVQVTVLHLQANGTPNVNGASSGNIVVRGWL